MTQGVWYPKGNNKSSSAHDTSTDSFCASPPTIVLFSVVVVSSVALILHVAEGVRGRGSPML